MDGIAFLVALTSVAVSWLVADVDEPQPVLSKVMAIMAAVDLKVSSGIFYVAKSLSVYWLLVGVDEPHPMVTKEIFLMTVMGIP